MTNAWKLLYIWRSRGGRSPEPPPPPDPDPGPLRRSRHRSHRNDDDHHRHHHHVARSSSAHHRNLCLRASLTEHETIRLDRRSAGDLEASNGHNSGVPFAVTSRVRLVSNNQLPDAVVQARERLIGRLRNVSLSGTRESIAASVIPGDEYALSHDLQNNDFVDTEDLSMRDWFRPNPQYVDFTNNTSKRKPSGVDWEALCTVYLDVIRSSEEIGDIAASLECSICLESFCEGDKLIRLHCGHRFHPLCLHPWVRTCSDCPYCRANITC